MSPFERWMLWGSTALVAISGFAFLGLKYLVAPADPYAIVNSPWQPFFLKLHILTAPLLVFAVGLVFLRHIWNQLRSGRPGGRRTGIAVLGVLVPMIATGYLLQTVSSREAAWWVALAHIVTGVAYVAAVAGHQLRSLAAGAGSRAEPEPAKVDTREEPAA